MKKYIEAIISGVLGLLLLIFPAIPVVAGGVSAYDVLSATGSGVACIDGMIAFISLSIIAGILLIAMCVVMSLNAAGIIKVGRINLSLINFIMLAVVSVVTLCTIICTAVFVGKAEGLMTIGAYSILTFIVAVIAMVADLFVWKKLAK